MLSQISKKKKEKGGWGRGVGKCICAEEAEQPPLKMLAPLETLVAELRGGRPSDKQAEERSMALGAPDHPQKQASNAIYPPTAAFTSPTPSTS